MTGFEPQISGVEADHSANSVSCRSRKASCSSQKDSTSGQSAEEFFIDVILQRHARKLLTAFRLHDLV